MKKAIAVICALVMTLGVLSACKKSDAETTTEKGANASTESTSSKAEQSQTEASATSETKKGEEKTSAKASTESTAKDTAETAAESTGEKKVEKDFPSFNTEDIFGAKVSSKVFSKNNLTMVYIFSTQTESSKDALVELAKLDKELQNIGFLAVALDINEGDGIDEKALRTAKEICTDADADYSYLITNDSLNKFCRNIYTVPATYFVNKNGKIVGDPVIGDKASKEWKEIVEQKLSMATK